MITNMRSYWNNRYKDGAIWGTDMCPSAVLARASFKEHGVKDILVPGCGYGRNSLYFAQEGFNVMAFDISDTAIEYAREQAARQALDNLAYDEISLFEPKPFKEKQFDGIYLSNIIHLFMETERKQVVKMMTSLLKPNGILAFTVLSVHDQGNYGKGEEIEPNTFMKHTDKLLHCYDEQELHTMLEPQYQILTKQLHTQIEPDPTGSIEELKLWYVAARKN